MTYFQKFEDGLLGKKKFYSSLIDTKIREVWNKPKMKKLKDYHNFYLKCDVLLLLEVFEKFRYKCFKNYILCPSRYLSATGVKRDVMLDMTKAELYLISGVDIYLLFEKGIRGGIS